MTSHAHAVLVGAKEGADVARLREAIARDVIDHVAGTDGRLAKPDDPLAKTRRQVLRGLRGGEPIRTRDEDRTRSD